MTEEFVLEIAKKYELKVDKRITTGVPGKPHFATFEISGPRKAVELAWGELQFKRRHRDFDHTRHSDIDHTLYITIESIYCEPEIGKIP